MNKPFLTDMGLTGAIITLFVALYARFTVSHAVPVDGSCNNNATDGSGGDVHSIIPDYSIPATGGDVIAYESRFLNFFAALCDSKFMLWR